MISIANHGGINNEKKKESSGNKASRRHRIQIRAIKPTLDLVLSAIPISPGESILEMNKSSRVTTRLMQDDSSTESLYRALGKSPQIRTSQRSSRQIESKTDLSKMIKKLLQSEPRISLV